MSAVLGPGASGDPEHPALSRDEFEGALASAPVAPPVLEPLPEPATAVPDDEQDQRGGKR